MPDVSVPPEQTVIGVVRARRPGDLLCTMSAMRPNARAFLIENDRSLAIVRCCRSGGRAAETADVNRGANRKLQADLRQAGWKRDRW